MTKAQRILNLHRQSKARCIGIPAREVALTLPCRVYGAEFKTAATRRQIAAVKPLTEAIKGMLGRLRVCAG